MIALCANMCIVLTLVVGLIFLRNNFRRSWDFLSWRNLFLLGLVHFYFLSAYFSASGEYTATLHHASEEAFFTLSMLLPTFLLLFLAGAHFGFGRTWLVRLIPQARMPVTTPALLIVAGACLFVALAFSLAPLYGFIGLLMAQLRSQLACVAMGLATFYLIARRFNPVSWAVFLSTLGVAVIIGTVGLSGRRYMLGILLIIPWMWYFAVWRYRSSSANFVRFAAAAVLGFMAVLIYSPLRGRDLGRMGEGATFDRRAQQLTELVTNPQIDTKVIKYIIYADTAPNTLFIIDNYPTNYAFMPLHGLTWFITNPIPRAFWPGKPEALGALLRDQMGVAANLGPGIIGHGWAEAGWLGVAGYALVFGLLFGAVDRALADRAQNPYFVAIFGSGLGNVIAVPRGDTPLFMLQITGGIIISLVVLWSVRAVAGAVVGAFPAITVNPTPGKWGYGAPPESLQSDPHDGSYGPENDQTDDTPEPVATSAEER